jgi:hypothetical protein
MPHIKTIRPQKNNKGKLLDLALLILSLTLCVSFIVGDLFTHNDIRVQNGASSIYSGRYPIEIASDWAAVFEKHQLERQETEVCAHTWTWRRFYYSNLTVQMILEHDHLSQFGNDNYIEIWSKDEPLSNASLGQEEAKDHVISLWSTFLKNMGTGLDDNSYVIEAVPSGHDNDSWTVKLRQTFNGQIPLENTGLDAYIRRDTMKVQLKVFDWVRGPIVRPAKISLEQTKVAVLEFNGTIYRLNITFEGYYYYLDHICYILKYETNETSMGIMSSTAAAITGFRLYTIVDIESGKCLGRYISN